MHMDPSKPRTRLRVQYPNQQACPQPQMYVVAVFAELERKGSATGGSYCLSQRRGLDITEVKSIANSIHANESRGFLGPLVSR